MDATIGSTYHRLATEWGQPGTTAPVVRHGGNLEVVKETRSHLGDALERHQDVFVDSRHLAHTGETVRQLPDGRLRKDYIKTTPGGSVETGLTVGRDGSETRRSLYRDQNGHPHSASYFEQHQDGSFVRRHDRLDENGRVTASREVRVNGRGGTATTSLHPDGSGTIVIRTPDGHGGYRQVTYARQDANGDWEVRPPRPAREAPPIRG